MRAASQPYPSRAALFLVRGNDPVPNDPAQHYQNGNGKLRNMLMVAGVVISLLSSSGSLIKSVYFSGGNEARIEEHLKYVDQRLDAQDKRLEHDEDRTEPMIDSLRETVRKERENADRQSQMLDDLYYKMKTGR